MDQIEVADAKLDGRRDKMSVWEEHLNGEVVQKITRELQEIMETYSELELTQTGLGRPASRSMLGGSTENHYSRFQTSFEGGYGPMQQVMAALETQMPHLVLEEFNIKPSQNPGTLSFHATYLCWHEDLNQNHP